MNFARILVHTVIIAAFLITTPCASHALIASPPLELTAIFNDYAHFEKAFKLRKWEEALSAIDGIDATFDKMLPRLDRDLKNNPAKMYYQISRNLRTSVKARDIDATQSHFIELHTFTFNLTNKYEYKTRPVFIVIAKYIAEAEEANNKNDFNRVVSEVDEISGILSFAENYLEKTDANRRLINQIKVQFLEIRTLAVYKKSNEIKSELKTLKKSFASLSKK